MSTDDIIIGLYVRVDSMIGTLLKHPQAELFPSELVTIGLLFALKGEGPRRFYRWLSANYRSWFPRLPERTRLFRLLATHADWTDYFLAQPTMLGVAHTYGIELRHPWREDRADMQIGGKGLSKLPLQTRGRSTLYSSLLRQVRWVQFPAIYATIYSKASSCTHPFERQALATV